MKVLATLHKVLVLIFVLLGISFIGVLVLLAQGYRILVVQSGSMQPAIPVGSIILVKPQSQISGSAAAPKFSSGEIITFNAGNALVSHRVVTVNEQDGEFYYRTKGDANQTEDSTAVAQSKVLGMTTLTVPVVGRFVNFVKNPAGFLLLVVIPSLFIIASEIIKLAKAWRSKPLQTENKLLLNSAVPLVVVFLAATYGFSTTFAFFSDTAATTNNAFTAAAVFVSPTPTPVPDPYIDEVVSVNGTFGHCCGDLSSDPAVAAPLVTGAPDGQFIQLSDNSVMILKFSNNKAIDLPGDDIKVYNIDALFPDSALFEVAQGPDCAAATYFSLGIFPDTSPVYLDIASTGLASVQCIKITDQVDPGSPYPLLGFDLDAIEALHSATVP